MIAGTCSGKLANVWSPPAHHDLPRTPVFPYRDPIVEHFVARFHQKQVAFGTHLGQ